MSRLDDEFYAVTFYMGGSWVYDALHNISDEKKKHLIMGFIDQMGREALDETINHQKHDGPLPQWLVKRLDG